MGKYDNIPPDRIQEALLRFALLVVRLEREGVLLKAAPELQSLMGDLRRMLFAHEVRRAPEIEEDSPSEEASDDEPGSDDSLRIVREALERERAFLRELEEGEAEGDDEGTDR